MLKISSKFRQSVNRYFTKNTVRAKYNRNMDTALFSGLAAAAQVVRCPVWNVYDVGITTFLGAVYVQSVGKAMKHLIELQPIRKRAIKIKKVAKKLYEKA